MNLYEESERERARERERERERERAHLERLGVFYPWSRTRKWAFKEPVVGAVDDDGGETRNRDREGIDPAVQAVQLSVLSVSTGRASSGTELGIHGADVRRRRRRRGGGERKGHDSIFSSQRMRLLIQEGILPLDGSN